MSVSVVLKPLTDFIYSLSKSAMALLYSESDCTYVSFTVLSERSAWWRSNTKKGWRRWRLLHSASFSWPRSSGWFI